MHRVPFLDLRPQLLELEREVSSTIEAVLARGVFVLGDGVSTFEREYATFTGVAHAVGVGNGLDALRISLEVCGVGEGDEVIVPSNTYLATWLAVTQMRARPVPVEPDPGTFNIDVSRIEEAITSRTKAIIPVHLFGQPCAMDAILEIAQRHNLFVIEDNAQAHGATWNERRTGSFGTVSATSFYPTKNLGCLGDGGAITTDSHAHAGFVRQFRNYGFREKNVADMRGINSRLDEIQAAVLSVKLKYLDRWNRERAVIAERYRESLEGMGDIILPKVQVGAAHVYHQFVIRTEKRDALKAFLESKGVETMIHYPVPPHLQIAFKNLELSKRRFPVTEKLADTTLSLPIYPGMAMGDLDRALASIRHFFKP